MTRRSFRCSRRPGSKWRSSYIRDMLGRADGPLLVLAGRDAHGDDRDRLSHLRRCGTVAPAPIGFAHGGGSFPARSTPGARLRSAPDLVAVRNKSRPEYLPVLGRFSHPTRHAGICFGWSGPIGWRWAPTTRFHSARICRARSSIR
jgi:hypothetical protein